MKYSDIISILKSKAIKFPQKAKLTPLPFNPFAGKASAYINAQVKMPISFAPTNGERTHVYLIDESGTPDLSDKDPIFQLGIVQGDEDIIASINKEINDLRSKWPDRTGKEAKFHHSKDPIQRKQLFEEYCLKRDNVSFLHYKIDKSRDDFRRFDQEHKATIYFSAIISAIHHSQYSHGKIRILASDRPNTFSNDLVYELKRVSRIQALIDMLNYPIVGCCLPEIELIRKSADDYPALDMSDYLISIIGSGDHSFQFKYGGCSLFEVRDDYEQWTVHQIYYSNDLFVPEGLVLKILKRKLPPCLTRGSIVSRIKDTKDISDSIKKCANEIERSYTKDAFMGSTIDLATRIGPYLDTKHAHIPFTQEEYLNIKSVGAYFKLLLDYGVVGSSEDPFSGRERFATLYWR